MLRRNVARVECVAKAIAIGSVWAFTSIIVVASLMLNLQG